MYLCVCVCVRARAHHIFFIHSSVDGVLGCLHVLTVVNSAAVDIGLHVSFGALFFSGYKPRSGTAGSYGW